MTDDQMLRSVVIGVFVVLIPIGIYYRVNSERTREKLDRRQEGLAILATLRPVGAVFWLAVIAWMIDPRWIAWAFVSIPLWARWLGAGLVVAGAGLTVWTFRSLGKNLTDTVVTRRAHTLVSYGPYRWVRHPLYDAVALLTLGLSLATANWFLLAAGVAVFSLLVVRTNIEERNLVARFGDSYRAYMNRTGRFLPRSRPGRDDVPSRSFP